MQNWWLLDFSNYSSFSVLLPVSAAYFVRKQINTRRLRFLALFFLLSALTEAASVITRSITGKNVIVGNFFIVIELSFWCYFIFDLLKRKYSIQILFIILVAMLMQWFIHIKNNTIWKYNSMFSILEASIILILSAYYLLQLSKSSIVPLHKVPEFWFVAGALIYFTSSFIALGIPRYLLLIHASEVIRNFVARFWIFYSVINIIANIMFSKGFLCISTKKT